MSDNIFLSLALNVGLLVLIATLLTKVPVVRQLLLDETNNIWSRIFLAIIFGSVSILSTYTGVGVNGAIVNTRVIGVIAAGLLGGPHVGIGAAIIAGVHRYLFDIGGFTAVSCAMSTFVEGMLGAFFSRYFRRGKWDNFSIFLLTAAAELCQMLIILLVAKPYSEALALVKIIAGPMILLNAFGMVAFIGTFNIVFMEEDHEAAGNMRLAFQIVDQCLPHLKRGLQNREHMEAAAGIIFDSIKCSCVMVTDTRQILACKSQPREAALFQIQDLPPASLEAMKTGKVAFCSSDEKEDPLYPILKNHVIIAAPFIEMEQPMGTLLLFVKKQWHSPGANISFADDLAKLFSTQLELSDLEYQKQLRKKAEFQALQSQVNPHFLYNALNTISSVCRENPERARELLLILATYYRQTLENKRFMLNLHTELYHVKNYLELEKARFEEKLQIEIVVPEEIHCMVPAFILQPLVENAIRYGADKRGIRYVRIQAAKDGDGIRIHVIDHGMGIGEEVIQRLYSGEDQDHSYGLGNVHKRLLTLYGDQGGLNIQTSSEGTDISFHVLSENSSRRISEERNEDNYEDSEYSTEYPTEHFTEETSEETKEETNEAAKEA